MFYWHEHYWWFQNIKGNALNIQIKLHGENCEIVAHTYNNLAGLFDESGDCEKAEKYYVKALNIFKKYYGENHPVTVLISHNLGAFYEEHDMLCDALTLLNNALQVRTDLFGDSHSDTAATLYNNAQVFPFLRQVRQSFSLIHQYKSTTNLKR